MQYTKLGKSGYEVSTIGFGAWAIGGKNWGKTDDEVSLKALNEAIDLPAAIKAMTINSAYIMNQDDLVGSIEIGKYADIIILDQNLFEIPVNKISETKVLKTILAGKVVFDYSSDPNEEDGIEEKYGLELDLSGKQGHPGCD